MKRVLDWLASLSYSLSIAVVTYLLLLLFVLALQHKEHMKVVKQPVILPYQTYCERKPSDCKEPGI